MKPFIGAFVIIGIVYLFLESFIIIRHEVDDSKYIELGKRYPSLCHFPMGEGVLIDSEWVLTAGQVGTGLKSDFREGYKPKVTIGSTDYEIDKVIVHPGFNPMSNDIALVKLKTPVSSITPAKLYTQNQETGKMITLVGMGDKVVRGATNRIDGTNDQWLWFDFDAPESPDGTDLEGISSSGDTGGPAYINVGNTNLVAGISSHQDDFGHSQGIYGVVEYYTRVSSYADWIQEVMGRD